jgi:2-methylcitrate dehydratase PrpD
VRNAADRDHCVQYIVAVGLLDAALVTGSKDVGDNVKIKRM